MTREAVGVCCLLIGAGLIVGHPLTVAFAAGFAAVLLWHLVREE